MTDINFKQNQIKIKMTESDKKFFSILFPVSLTAFFTSVISIPFYNRYYKNISYTPGLPYAMGFRALGIATMLTLSSAGIVVSLVYRTWGIGSIIELDARLKEWKANKENKKI